jgi:hypothetical protein
MNDIVEHPNGGTSDPQLVRIGESNNSVSLKAYQDIYHQVTGRTEQIRKRHFDNFLLEYSDLEQLHHKIMQLCDVHRVVARNETISVFHDKERKEQFTSFERFAAYNANATSPCVSVILKYNFSLIPAGLQKPQEYVVTIRLISRIALLEQMDDEAPPFLRGGYFGYVHESTAEVTIDYVDYVIARGFVEATDEWAKGCKSNSQNQVLNFCRRHSHWVGLVFRLIVSSLTVFFAWGAASALGATLASQEQWIKLLITYVGGAYILLLMTSPFSSFIEQSVDGYPELAYLKLNRGDEKLIEAFTKRRKAAYWKFAFGLAGNISVGIAAAKLERLL